MIRAQGNPYSFSEIKFLWLNNEQLVDSKWQMGAINCRCTITRSPSDDEFAGNRFEGQENLFKRTVDIAF